MASTFKNLTYEEIVSLFPNFTIKQEDGKTTIIIPDEKKEKEETVFNKNLSDSHPCEMILNGEKKKTKSWHSTLIYLYSKIDRKTILNNTTLNITTEKKKIKGFKEYPNLGLSIQYTNSSKVLKEIINMVRVNNYSMKLKIKLKNDEIIYFRM